MEESELEIVLYEDEPATHKVAGSAIFQIAGPEENKLDLFSSLERVNIDPGVKKVAGNLMRNFNMISMFITSPKEEREKSMTSMLDQFRHSRFLSTTSFKEDRGCCICATLVEQINDNLNNIYAYISEPQLFVFYRQANWGSSELEQTLTQILNDDFFNLEFVDQQITSELESINGVIINLDEISNSNLDNTWIENLYHQAYQKILDDRLVSWLEMMQAQTTEETGHPGSPLDPDCWFRFEILIPT